MADMKVSAHRFSQGDAAPVLEPAEHVLDAITLPVKRLVIGDRQLAAAA
jgi:hypothetical protein